MPIKIHIKSIFVVTQSDILTILFSLNITDNPTLTPKTLNYLLIRFVKRKRDPFDSGESRDVYNVAASLSKMTRKTIYVPVLFTLGNKLRPNRPLWLNVSCTYTATCK